MTPSVPWDAYSRSRNLTRWIRYAVYVTVIAMLWYLFSRYSFVQLEKGEAPISEVSGFRRLLVESLDDEGRSITSGDAVVFAVLDERDNQVFKVSRVAAMPGDLVGGVGGFYSVNGKTLPVPLTGTRDLKGEVPDGFYLLLNDNLLSDSADSRRIGWIDRRWILGRFVAELPF